MKNPDVFTMGDSPSDEDLKEIQNELEKEGLVSMELTDEDIDDLMKNLQEMFGEEMDGTITIGEAMQLVKKYKEKAAELDFYFNSTFDWRAFNKKK